MKLETAKRIYKGFWQLADPKIWIASTIPMAVGGALAYGNTGHFDLYWFIVSLAGIYFIEIGKNAVNEFVDYQTGVDRYVAPDKKTPFSGGKKTIVEGKLTVSEVKAIALVTFLMAAATGLYVALFREMNIIWIGLPGIFLAIFYSLPPFKFNYRGLGEVVVGLTFGPLILSGIYLVLTHTLDIRAVLASLPIGFIVANILWINQYPDYEADKKGNKKNWVVRLGKKNGIRIYALLFAATFASFVLLSIVFANPLWLMGLIGLPSAINSVRIAGKYYDDIPNLIQANAKTIIIYQITGFAMLVASLSNHFI